MLVREVTEFFGMVCVVQLRPPCVTDLFFTGARRSRSLTFGDHEAMTLGDRSDVHERKHCLGLEQLHPAYTLASHQEISPSDGTHDGISPTVDQPPAVVD